MFSFHIKNPIYFYGRIKFIKQYYISLIREEERFMQATVKVTRRGQTTIPKELRERFQIKEGDQLLVEITEKGILFKLIPRLEQLAGIDAKYGEKEQIKREIEKLREEY